MDKDRRPLTSDFSARLFDRAPRLLALLTFLAGAIALVSAAIPADPVAVQKPLQRWLTEAPILGLTFGSLALMALSLGLARRLRTAWTLALIVVLHGIVASGIFRPRMIEMGMYIALFVALLGSRKNFYRRSKLSKIAFNRTWFLATLLAIFCAGFFSLLWVSHQKGFVEASFIDLVVDPILGTAGRPVALALLIVALGAFYLIIASPARARSHLAGNADFEKITHLLNTGEDLRPDNILTFVGDKSVFYGPNGISALAYAEIGGVRIALGPPIGPRNDWKATLEAFRKSAEADAVRPAIYSAPPDLLPDLLDLSFKVEKVGENAILELPEFTLSGRKREVIRRSRRKLAERAGASFELVEPPHSSALIDSLRPISEAWLSANGSKEKSFSLGRFDPDFLDRCPIGIVKLHGKIVAFGTLLVTPDRAWAGIDIMRYDPGGAVTNTMDFLLVELILWAKDAGYEKFDLAMAPLSGLVQAEFAPLYARIGHFVYERGERFYNFRGLRRFKQKFDPIWEPRYIAAPGYWSLPIVLAQVGLLTNSSTSSDPTRADEAAKP